MTMFKPFPRTTRVIPPGQHEFAYVKPSRMVGLTWERGAEWTSPTSLDFQASAATADHLAARRAMPLGEPIPPVIVIGEIKEMWDSLHTLLARADRVVDVHQIAGVTFDVDQFSKRVVMGVRLKTWPAIAGITTSGGWGTG